MPILEKLMLTGIILVAMLPGLIIEPGPLSEIAGIGLIVLIWLPDSEAAGQVDELT